MNSDQKLRIDICIFEKFQIVNWNFWEKMHLNLNCILYKLESIQLAPNVKFEVQLAPSHLVSLPKKISIQLIQDRLPKENIYVVWWISHNH